MMKKIQQILLVSLFALICGSPAMAQRSAAPANGSNIFLNRSYWESKPAIAEIEENIAKGHSVTEANGGGFDPVTFAIFADNPVETIDYLVKKGNSVNKRTHDSRTYAFWAASRGNLEVMEYLVSNGAKLDLKDSHGYSPLLFTAATGQEDPAVYDFFIAQGADIQNEKDHHGRNAMLVMAPGMENEKMLNYFSEKGMDIQDTDEDGNGIFHHAAKGGNKDFLKLLVEKGVSTAPNEATGENAIFFASSGRRGNPMEVYTYLESLGLEANVQTVDGVTPVHQLARSTSDLEVYNYFLNKGVDVDQADKDGNTALLIAAERNKPEVITYLAERSGNISHTNKDGISALTKAVQGNSAEVVSYLISKNADAGVVDKAGNNLAYYLVSSFRGRADENFETKMDALSAAGVDFKSEQEKGKNLFHLAMEKDNPELLKRIHALGVDVNAKDADGNTPLHYAAMKTDNAEVLRYLLSIGADESATTDFGETAYDLAAENELLQKKNVNISFLN